jgi:amino acid adenylation domain-containing protein
VAWCSGKSPWTVVGLIAIIKSGGTVIFLDPSHPPSRRRELLRASQPRVILAIPPHDSLFSADDDMPVPDAVVLPLDVNQLAERDLPERSLVPAPSSIPPSNGLYVQFTTGSTGTPKGCVVEHGSFLSSATIYTKRTRLDRSARVYQLSSYSFDGSLLEMLAALTAGACVCVPREEARYDDLAGSINDLRISWSVMTPSLARTLPVDGVPTLRDLMLAGEAVSPMDVTRWSSRLSSSSIRLYNGYGPAECSILAHVNTITENAEIPADELGKPLASRSWIVEPNDTEKLVPLGAVGELLIDGPIVGRCYLNDPQRTAAAYIDPPQWLRDFNSTNGDIGTGNRVYLTGDLVRYTSDGSISYVRRKDTQVKIRGQRAELGEIEHRLWADDKVDSAVVLYPKTGQCKGQLVGFVSFAADAKKAETLSSAQKSGREAVALLPEDELLAASSDLRQVEASLSSQLPSYMIPTLWVPLVSIPLLVSGKANRRALLDWLASVDQETLSLLATLGVSQDDGSGQVKKDERLWTPVEETLRSIWSKVLGLSEARISLDSSFSRLGGNSISAMQVDGLARIAELHLPVSAMIRAKTLEDLAASAKPISNANARSDARTVIGKAFPLSPMQQFYGQVARNDDELSRSTDKQFHYAFPFRLTSRVNWPHLDEALRRIVSRHPLLRALFRREQGQHVQEITEDARGSYRLQAHQ